MMARAQIHAAVIPPHPGLVLRDRVLPGLQLSVSRAARELRIARQTLHRVLAGTTAVRQKWQPAWLAFQAQRPSSGWTCSNSTTSGMPSRHLPMFCN